MKKNQSFNSYVLPSQPRMLNDRQTLATNKAENRCSEVSNARDRETEAKLQFRKYKRERVEDLVCQTSSRRDFMPNCKIRDFKSNILP